MPGPQAGGAVLDVGAGEAFDASWTSCPSVLFDGRTYRMWYSSFYDSRQGHGGIGLATSHDGLNWTRQNASRPVLELGPAKSLDDGQVMGPEVLFDGHEYRMWYTGMDRQRHASGLGHYRIFLVTSRDGLNWKRQNAGRPVLDLGPAGSADEVQAATPSILKTAAGYRMWYAAWSPRHGHTLCVADSFDGLIWRRANGGQPVAGITGEAYGQAVCRWESGYLMLFMTLRGGPGLYAATSRDGLQWTMLHAGEPVLSPDAESLPGLTRLGHAFLLPRNDRLQAWFTGYYAPTGQSRQLVLRIGLAEIPLAGNASAK